MTSAYKNAPGATSEEQTRTQTNQVLATLKSAYESESLSDFMNLLDKDYEDRLTFQSNLQNYFISNKNPELIIITDAVVVTKDKISVRLHWFKKNFSNEGVFSKSQGSSQFAFIKSTQGLRLIYLRGDNPFY
jgi:hypothetical protein